MFDFQVEEDARLAREAVAQAKNRKRPWGPVDLFGPEFASHWHVDAL
jgi:hypothetical protein